MKVRLIVALVGAIFSSGVMAETVLGVGAGASFSPNSTSIGENAFASGDDGVTTLTPSAPNFTLGSVAVGINSAALGNGVAIGSGAQSFSQYIDNAGNYHGVAIGAGALSLGNGVALGAGSVAQDGTVGVGFREITDVVAGQSLGSAVNLGQVQLMLSTIHPSVELDPITANFTVDLAGPPDLALGDAFINAAPTNATVPDGLNVNIGADAGGDGISGAAPGFNNINLGTAAGFGSSGNGNITQGFLSGLGAQGDNNVSIGSGAGGVNGNGNVNLGDGAGSFSNSNNSVNVGSNTDSEVDGGVAIGNNATVALTASNSVALGQNSIAAEANTVSVGHVGNERRITNVADPINDTDAVNLRTLMKFAGGKDYDPEIKRLDKRIDKLQRRSFGGTALALAMAGSPPDAGHDASVSVGTAMFESEGALAVALQLKNIGNDAIVNMGAGITSAGDVGVRAAITWQWNPTSSKTKKKGV